MKREEIEEIACTIIANAGDATDFCYQSLESAKKGDFSASEENMKKSDEAIKAAHKAQLELLAEEAKGADLPYSIIMVHAQDHLMNAISVKKTVKELIDLYKFIREVIK